MKKFYDDPKLGIKTEDAPANASGSAVAGTGDDSSTVVVKKKKNPYDGRTKEARQFYKRMAERRAKREAKSKLAQKVQSSNSVVMENQIKEETENTYRNYRKSRNSDEKLKKINDDLEPILAT